jgi:hypothetical protein
MCDSLSSTRDSFGRIKVVSLQRLASTARFTLRLVLPTLLVLTVPVQANTLDFRKQPDQDGRYSVAICARPSPDSARGVPAHAFVVWRQASHDHDVERVSRAAGYVPNGELRSFIGSSTSLGSNASQLSQEAYGFTEGPCLELLVSKREFEATGNLAPASFKRMASAKPETEAGKVYSLEQEDASGFIAEIAVRFSNRGLYVPKRRLGEPPLAFVRRLIDANAAR